MAMQCRVTEPFTGVLPKDQVPNAEDYENSEKYLHLGYRFANHQVLKIQHLTFLLTDVTTIEESHFLTKIFRLDTISLKTKHLN